jgi:transposase
VGTDEVRRTESGSTDSAPRSTRWSTARKQSAVLRLLRGESLDAVSRELAVPIYKLERWQKKALAGLADGLKEREGDPLQREHDEALKRVGELTMEVELLRHKIEGMESGHPFAGRRRSRR